MYMFVRLNINYMCELYLYDVFYENSAKSTVTN